jgi:hypothetical protein
MMSPRPVTRRAVLPDGGALVSGLLTGHHARRDGGPPGITRLAFRLDDDRPRPPEADRPRRDAPQGRVSELFMEWTTDVEPLRIEVLGLGPWGAQALASLALGRGTSTVERCSPAEAQQAVSACDLVILVAPWSEAEPMRQAAQLAQRAATHAICTLAIGSVAGAGVERDQHQQAQTGLALLRPWVRGLFTLPPVRGRQARPDGTGGVAPGAPGDLRAGQAIEGLIDFLRPGLVCVDLADLTSIFRGEGPVMVGVGQATGAARALAAAHRAMAQTWSTPAALGRVQAVLVTIRGSRDMSLEELHIAASTVSTAISTETWFLFSGLHDPALQDTVRVTLVAMGT